MKKEDNITPKKYVCNLFGDIYNVEFKKAKDFDVEKYTSFIEDLKHVNLDLFLKTITNISTDDLVNYFNNLDVNALNLLYCKCVTLDTNDSHNVSDLIINYFESFIECKKKMFCSKKEADTIIKASTSPLFINQESTVVKKIIMAIKLDIIKVINDEQKLERNHRVSLKKIFT